jgi:DNA replication protein DnaC
MNLDTLNTTLRSLRLPSFVDHAQDLANQAEREGWGYMGYLHHLAQVESQQRVARRVERMQRHSGLPHCKTLATLDQARLSPVVRRSINELCTGKFVEEARNVLAFGLPGLGKTHVVAAIGHALIQQGFSVLFVPTYKLVQKLLLAKQELRLDKELRRLDAFDAVICDDIGYVQQNRDEMEVLFTFLAERYERKSVLITSNLVFSQWDRIFKDPMTTAAAIDRLVHHSVILEMAGESYRKDTAATARGLTGVDCAGPAAAAAALPAPSARNDGKTVDRADPAAAAAAPPAASAREAGNVKK